MQIRLLDSSGSLCPLVLASFLFIPSSPLFFFSSTRLLFFILISYSILYLSFRLPYGSWQLDNVCN
ncbi:hypothetical protein ASPZODRAFT_135834, partial [Penicilliopsis zonata CBS 506.65]